MTLCNPNPGILLIKEVACACQSLKDMNQLKNTEFKCR